MLKILSKTSIITLYIRQKYPNRERSVKLFLTDFGLDILNIWRKYSDTAIKIIHKKTINIENKIVIN